MRGAFLTFVIALSGGAACAAGLKDSFDSDRLNTANWTTQQILSRQYQFQKPGRCGSAAIDIVTTDGDNGLECEDDCQRAELRTTKKTWPVFGDEVWYGFSFKITGDVPSTGSARSVIGQWKGPGDGSPMIAQRFDNGVFHITVQDNNVRRVVARAEGDPDASLSAQALLGNLHRDERTVNAINSLQSLDLFTKTQPDLSQQFFKQNLMDSLGPEAQPSDSQQLSQALGLGDPALVGQFSALSFVAEPGKYIGRADIDIETEDNRSLPDPRKDWVDMVYRIKPGRTDNEYGPRRPGEIDIWANGQKIVSVRGNIGATLRTNDPRPLVGPYFKFGTYRLRIPGTFHFQFDEFSQASTRAGLGQICAAR
ncbi:heparin lyase I family protein [Rhizobium leguminosarum]|uniref:heparin lyase I family protein n=1 Tax=Rhizobium leguminosarum TaxID=384 RepID=UPI0024A8DC78|nr:heparin lyase I family protein [Rhizobium leguminosarum]MDI5929286.1 heparin lyase I family protein [Rhizobium leguminosarum]